MRILAATFAGAMLLGQAAVAEVTKVAANGSVAETMDALVAAVEGAGAKVFARVDHAAGAQSVEMELAASQVLIFGNPKLGTPAIQADPLAGLYLPMKVLVYEDSEGAVWLAYEPPAEMLAGTGVPADARVVDMMTGALGKLTGAAAGG